jgi:1,4-dihydroxy-2-naphthoate octaprenyltransferase
MWFPWGVFATLVLAARPKTLPAAIVPVWLGCALAWKLHGSFDALLAFCTVASATSIQLASNFFNDALDFHKGADTARRLGPTRVTASGMMKPGTVMALGALALLVAAAFAWPLIAARGWPILAIGLPSMYFSFGYTGGPFPLAYRGLGELFVLLFFGLVAATGTVFVQTGQWDARALLLGMQVGALATALIAINNLRDVAEDRTTGKRTLAVRFGESWAKREIAILLGAPFLLGLVWWPLGQSGAALGPVLALPMAITIARQIRRLPPGAEYNRLLARAGLTLVLFAAGFHVGLCWL